MQGEPADHPGAIPAAEAGDAVRGAPVTPEQVSRTETTEAARGESGGLPQFRFEYWGGQIVWLVVLFTLLYLLLSRVFTPRLRRVFDERETAIGGAIAEARRVRAEADAQAKATHDEMAQARAQAQRTAADAKARSATEAKARQTAQEAELNAKLAEAEARIAASRDAAMGSVRQVAAEATAAIVERLTGEAPAPADVDAALEARA